MEQIKMSAIWGPVVFLVFLWLLPSVGEAKTFKITCSATKKIGSFVTKVKPGDVIEVSGACEENLVVPEQVHNITIDGSKAGATINGPDTTRATVLIRGQGITIKGFKITGGENGILVQRGGVATIDGNTIDCALETKRGIVVNQNSHARIVNNTIQDCTEDGIVVSESSSARIGFLSTDDTAASPNTIMGNTGEGIVVVRSSSARIVGSTISGNGSHGVSVSRASHGDLAGNTLDSNGGSGVNINLNSAVNLGDDTDTVESIFDDPNSTTPGSENTDAGVRCRNGGAADGVLGTLNGVAAAKDFSGSCIDSLS
jgi:parallel beta-helix repeat protein